jgi:hypothetical protein
MDGAGANAVFRARIGILSILALLGAAASFRLAFLFHRLPELALVVVCLAAISYAQLRHAGLTALVIAAPLPGVLGASLASVLIFPGSHRTAFPLVAYLAGFFVADTLAAEIALRVGEGSPPPAASQGAQAQLMPAVLGALALAVLFAARNPLAWSAATAGAGLCAWIALPLAASFLPFGEDYIARINRLRERREHWLDYLAPFAYPRWGWSLSGVAVILCVLGYFEAARAVPAWPQVSRADLIWLGSILTLLAGAVLAIRDWRRALAALLACLPAAFLALWLLAGSRAWSAGWPALGLGAMAVYFISARTASFVQAGEPASVASLRALTRHGAAILFAAAACALPLALFDRMTGIAPAAAVLLGAFNALVFAPAFSIVIEGLFPRRATIEARYRVR